MNYLGQLDEKELDSYNYRGPNSQKLTIPDSGNLDALQSDLKVAKKKDKRFVVLGIPEGIGPYANKGRNGAFGAWSAFLEYFDNYLNDDITQKTILLGKIDLEDLQRRSFYYDNSLAADRQELRRMTEEIDRRVAPVVHAIFKAGLIPIVIGGGHNNAYPLIKEAARIRGHRISCVNLDLHADLRETDGRHSGNSFSYAFKNNLMRKYYIFGLHENYHSTDYFDKIKKLKMEGKIDFSTYSQITETFNRSFENEINRTVSWLQNQDIKHLGLEVDLDSVEGVPASAITELRIPFLFAMRYVKRMVSEFSPLYLNLSEGAPDLGKRNSRQVVGDSISRLLVNFISQYNF
jgi:formiminoglutamase